MKRTTAQSHKTRIALFEALETRRLMSASPFLIYGTNGSDVITVNYGANLVAKASDSPSTSTTATSTSNVTGVATTVARTSVTSVAATQAVASNTATARIFHAPPIATIFDRLTYTVNGIVTTTILQPGQSIQVNGLDGNDKITVTGSVNAEINGGNGNDSIISGAGNDSLNGGDGNDFLDGGFGADQINGGAGTDTVDYSSRTHDVRVSLDGVANDGETAEGDNVSNDIEIINGGWGNDYLAGNPNDTVARQFYGHFGNDLIVGGGGDDQIYGQEGNDNVYGGAGNDLIHGGANDDVERGGLGDDIIYADSGFDAAYGDAGNDRIFGGTGVNYLHGGAGDDILVSIGGSHIDLQYGEGGLNSFWLDAESTESVADATSVERAMGNVHRVANYEPLKVGNQLVQPARGMYVGNLPDPQTTVIDPTKSNARFGTANFASHPLFSPGGPVESDVNQGNLGDCYFVAGLSATAQICQNQIRQSVVDLGDGTYAVQFKRDGVSHFVRVDADLPVSSSGDMVYAHWGVNGNQSLWVQVMEKAWAFFRSNSGTYASAESGTGTETFAALGMSNDNYNPNGIIFGILGDSPQEFGQKIASLKAAGNAVLLCTQHQGGFLINAHEYVVDHVNKIGNTIVSISLRNPWGTDGPNPNHDASNDGFITLDATEALASCAHLAYGHP